MYEYTRENKKTKQQTYQHLLKNLFLKKKDFQAEALEAKEQDHGMKSLSMLQDDQIYLFDFCSQFLYHRAGKSLLYPIILPNNISSALFLRSLFGSPFCKDSEKSFISRQSNDNPDLFFI